MRFLIATPLFIFVFLLPASAALAQFSGGQTSFGALAQQNGPRLVTTPTYPQPGDQVQVSLDDYSSGVYGATLSWYLDGELLPGTQNQRTITLTAGNSGERQVVKLIMQSAEESQTIERTITPRYLDIVIEPQTRAPEHYLGRSLPSIGSIVNATALLSDINIPASNLIYTWRLNQQVLERGPIRGRNLVSFEVPRGTTMLLSVKVSTSNGATLAERSVVVPSVDPVVRFYEVNALYGLRSVAVGQTVPISGSNIVLRAEPYHLDSRVYNNPDILEWKVNRQLTNSGSRNPYEITLQKTGVVGFTTLGFHVRDEQTVLQGVEDSVRLSF